MDIKRIELNSLNNTRDLGGFKTTDDKQIKYKKLIRSGQLGIASAADIGFLLNEYQIKTVIDLRTDAEVLEKPDILPDNVEIINIPLIDNSYLGIARDKYSVNCWFNIFENSDLEPKEVFYNMYHMLVFSERTSKLIKQFFNILINNDSPCILWHCSAGKDRVGVLTFLLLLALGVKKETIINDYLATNIFTKNDVLMAKLSSAVNNDNKKLKCLSVLMGVDKYYIEKLLNEIELGFNGIEDFFCKQYGISQNDLISLKNKYLI